METFWQNTWDFLSLKEANVRYVVLGSVLLSAASAWVGCFAYLRKRSLTGDAVAHAVLPGICLAFLIFHSKSTWVLLLGALASGALSLLVMDAIKKYSRLKEDTAIALVLSVFFGLGIMLLTAIQQSGEASQSGLDKFLFGKAASLVGEDLYTFAAVAVLILGISVVFLKEFTLLSFDPVLAQTSGLPVGGLERAMTLITVLAVVAGIQSVGVVLMAAMLITPAAAARFYTDDIKKMLYIAAGIGAASGWVGAYVSYLAPSMPTGPWIVMVASGVALVSFLWAPKRGLWAKMQQQRSIRQQMAEENALKTFYHLGESDEAFTQARSLPQLLQRRPMEPEQLRLAVSRLVKKGQLKQEKQGFYALTLSGLAEGQRVARLHRLWELYLTHRLRIQADHVHEDAELVEHLLTPELESRLVALLDNPQTGVHGEPIPPAPTQF